MIEVLILSLIQGITEFLPISSSSHLIVMSEYLNFEDRSLSIDVSLHIGSFIAVIIYFIKDIINFVKNKELFFKIIFSSIPTMVIGYILVKYNLIEYLRYIKIISLTTIIFGLLLYFSDKLPNDKNLNNNFTLYSALFIGVFQILSLIPGVSRSGITITAARILKFKRVEAAKISFLLSIPTLGAVTIFGINNLLSLQNTLFSSLNILAISCSFIISYLTIKFFLKYIERFSLNLFVIYRLILGVILLIFAYL